MPCCRPAAPTTRPLFAATSSSPSEAWRGCCSCWASSSSRRHSGSNADSAAVGEGPGRRAARSDDLSRPGSVVLVEETTEHISRADRARADRAPSTKRRELTTELTRRNIPAHRGGASPAAEASQPQVGAEIMMSTTTIWKGFRPGAEAAEAPVLGLLPVLGRLPVAIAVGRHLDVARAGVSRSARSAKRS